MSTTQALIDRMKAELKSAGLTYAALARELGMAESSIKRMFARGEMPLSRVDEICRVLKTDFAELARHVADTKPQRRELTLEQERLGAGSRSGSHAREFQSAGTLAGRVAERPTGAVRPA